MEVKILQESGYEEALMGMSLSFYDNSLPIEQWWTQEKFEKAQKRANKLAHMQGGHNKLIEQIMVWVYVKAPLSWWKHADTYRISSKQSSSTMHTIKKRHPLTKSDFSESTHQAMINCFNTIVHNEKDISVHADNLPDGFLQERIWLLSYKTLQNVIFQRDGHRLGHWAYFIKLLMEQIEHPELLVQEKK